MEFDDIESWESRVYANVFNRLPLALTRGEGVFMWDTEDKKYLDFCAGIAVNCLGHAHPEITKTLTEQAAKLTHTSNWFYTLPQLELAEKLVSLTGLERVFFTNDGSESVECALKLVRAASGKKEVVAMKNAFHGRTMGSLSLTWGEKYRKPFMPLVPGVKFVDYGSVDAVEDAVSSDTAAVIVEPIQGEAGVNVPPDGYLKALRDVTQDKGVSLILDEVQTGLGRTGGWFAFLREKIKPDVLCLSKALGGGFPIGATVYAGMDFKKSEHGGTFLGSPLACSVALKVLEVIERENLSENARNLGEYLMKGIGGLGLECRGRGLMIGFEVPDGGKTVLDLIGKGVLTIHSKNTVRVLPPLIINREHAKLFIKRLSEVA